MSEENKFGNWIKKALYNPEQVTTQTQQPQSQPVNPPSRISSPIVQTQPVSTVVIPEDNGEIDESYINHLSEFMEKNNQPGPDYLEFAKSLDEMITEMGSGASEEKIFQMTYKVGYKQNLPVQKLLDTAKIYIDLFTGHKKEFEKWLDTESQKIVGSKVTENDNLTKANLDANKKIEELKTQIQNLEASVKQNENKINENSTVIDTETKVLQSKKTKFENAFNFIVGNVNSDIEKITKYLKGL